MKFWMIVLALALPTAAANAATAKLPGLPPDELALYERLCFQVEDSYDSTRGGFVDKHGIPYESATDLAFLLGSRKGGANWSSRAISTVNVMLTFEDTLRGGFHGAVENGLGDSELNRPTALNARRLASLIRAWAVTGETRYWVSAVRLLEFAERNVVDGRGGFVPDPVGDMQLIPEVNGVAIRSWLLWWAVGRDARHKTFAHKSLDRVWEVCWMDSVGFVRHDAFNEPLEWPLLLDQAEMGRALLMSAHLTGRDEDLERAKTVADLMLRQFEDPKRGGFASKVTSKKGQISASGRESAENARACLFLCEIAHVTGDVRYLDAARRAWVSFEKTLRKPRQEAADWALAMDAAMGPDLPTPPPEPVRSEDPRKKPTDRRNRSKSPAAKMGASGTP